ncbi:MAG: DNA repair protein RecO [Oscillospiraceae bacterium]|jgi:DNA repair protein RecO (recombination protein O)|nr:DNA repair protein RecO [Oscillospiraceae bacterium]
MPELETSAIVLRRSNYRDWDRMLTLFSPDYGLIDAVARGIRRPSARIRTAGEPFAAGQAALVVSGGRATLSGFELTEGFYPLREDYGRLTLAAYALNACGRVIQPSAPDPELFALLLGTLGRLAYTDRDGDELLARFLLTMMRGEGIAPTVRVCAKCGKDITDDVPAAGLRVSVPEGGICCGACAPYGRRVRAETLEWLRAAERAELDDVLPPFVSGAGDLLRVFFEGYGGRPRTSPRRG